MDIFRVKDPCASSASLPFSYLTIYHSMLIFTSCQSLNKWGEGVHVKHYFSFSSLLTPTVLPPAAVTMAEEDPTQVVVLTKLTSDVAELEGELAALEDSVKMSEACSG